MPVENRFRSLFATVHHYLGINCIICPHPVNRQPETKEQNRWSGESIACGPWTVVPPLAIIPPPPATKLYPPAELVSIFTP